MLGCFLTARLAHTNTHANTGGGGVHAGAVIWMVQRLHVTKKVHKQKKTSTIISKLALSSQYMEEWGCTNTWRTKRASQEQAELTQPIITKTSG